MSKNQNKILSYDEIMSMFAESARRHEELDRFMKESAREFDRRREESAREFDRRREESAREFKSWLAESAEESDKRHKKLEKLVGGMSENIGHHAEQFFQDALAQTLTFGGEMYDRIHRNLDASDKKSGVEFDIVLVNGKSVAIIEAKNRIHQNDVKKLAEESIIKFRDFFPLYKNHKVYLGIAGFSFSNAVLEQAQEYGMGIIRQVGEAIEVEADHLKAY